MANPSGPSSFEKKPSIARPKKNSVIMLNNKCCPSAWISPYVMRREYSFCRSTAGGHRIRRRNSAASLKANNETMQVIAMMTSVLIKAVPIAVCGARSYRTAPLAIRLFPIAGLAFGPPFHRLRKPFRSSFVPLGLGDPFDVFALVARCEFLEHRRRALVFLQCRRQIARNRQRPFSRRRPRQFDAAFVERHSFANITGDYFIRR